MITKVQRSQHVQDRQLELQNASRHMTYYFFYVLTALCHVVVFTMTFITVYTALIVSMFSRIFLSLEKVRSSKLLCFVFGGFAESIHY